MSAQAFASFGQAAAFARRMAQDQRISVRIARRGNEFVVEEPAQPSEGAGSAPIAGPLPPPGASGPGSAVAALAGDRRCIECGAVISPARVLALPEVARCVICQSEDPDEHAIAHEGIVGTTAGDLTQEIEVSESSRASIERRGFWRISERSTPAL